VKRRGFGAVLAAAPLVVSFAPDIGEGSPFPYAHRVPADAAIYVSVPDLPDFLNRVEGHPEWIRALGLAPWIERLTPARPWLAGPAAFYAVLRHGRLEWNALLRLRSGQTYVEGADYSGADSLHRILAPFENDPPRPRLVFNFDAMPPAVRELWGEFSRAILEIGIERSLVLRGTLTYRPGARLEMMERRVHASPTPEPGPGILVHSGLSDIERLCEALDLHPPLPSRVRRSLGPAWGLEVRSADDLALWFEARGDALKIRPTQWNGFHVQLEQGRLVLRHGRSPLPGIPGVHAQTRVDSAEAAVALRRLLGPRAEPLASILTHTSQIDSRLLYRGEEAELELRLSPPLDTLRTR